MLKWLAMLAVLVATPAYAQEDRTPFETGNKFVRMCVTDLWKLPCVTYAVGVYEGSQIKSATVCLPDGVDNGQLLAVGVAFIKDHPDTAHLIPSVLLLASWERAFPCPKP